MKKHDRSGGDAADVQEDRPWICRGLRYQSASRGRGRLSMPARTSRTARGWRSITVQKNTRAHLNWVWGGKVRRVSLDVHFRRYMDGGDCLAGLGDAIDGVRHQLGAA